MKTILRNDRGMVLATLIGFITVLAIGFTAMSALTAQKASAQHRSMHSIQAMYLAEAAVEQAKVDLSASFATLPSANEGNVYTMGDGEYYFDIAATADPDVHLVTGYGAIPDFDNPEQQRSIQVEIASVPTTIPITFDYAIMAANTININGSANTITGDIFAGNDISCSPATCPGVVGDKTEEGEPNYPFPALDMETMKAIAISQGNYFSSTPSASALPTSFYHTPPSGSNPGIPNIVYIEGTLSVGSGQRPGGLLIVAGNYNTNPTNPQGNVTLSGNAAVEGVIYSMGTTTFNGGGSTSPTVNGSVYAQNTVTVNGKPTITKSSTYTSALDAAEFEAGEIASSGWNEV